MRGLFCRDELTSEGITEDFHPSRGRHHEECFLTLPLDALWHEPVRSAIRALKSC